MCIRDRHATVACVFDSFNRPAYTSSYTVQDWPGKQKFYKDGKFYMQYTWAGAFRTVLLILALEGLFLGLVARRLNSPWDIIAMTTSYAFFLCISCSCRCNRLQHIILLLPTSCAPAGQNIRLACCSVDEFNGMLLC